MAPRVGIVVFPGTNCEHDVASAVEHLGAEPRLCWHTERELGDVDAVVLPGGFAYGDYLRPGALARFSPVMDAVGAFAAKGGAVVGICNGFQVLTEAGLLPGALHKNRDLKFLCTTVAVRVDSARSVLTAGLEVGTVLHLPINHFDGNYVCGAQTLAELRAREGVILRYVDDPNGSVDRIAGITNAAGNVVGLMPHPERASGELIGSSDGLLLLGALLRSARVGAAG